MKKQVHTEVFVLILLTFVVSLISCTVKEPGFYQIRYASMDNAEEPMIKVVNKAWARWLERESNGRIKMNFITSEKAAKASDIYDAVKLGIADMGDQYMGISTTNFPLNQMTELPLIFDYPAARQSSLTHMALYDKYAEMQEEFKDVKVISFHYTNPVQIHNTKRNIETLEDLKGLRIIAISKYDAIALKSLGAIPQEIAPTEENLALSKGLVDGIGCNYTAMIAFDFIEPLKYSTIVNLSNPGRVEVMNLELWNNLTPDLQKLFGGEYAIAKSKLYGHQLDIEDQKDKDIFNTKLISQGLPGIHYLSETERRRWIDVIQPIQQEWVNNMEAKGLPAKAILEDCMSLANQYIYTGFDQESEDILHAWGAFGH